MSGAGSRSGQLRRARALSAAARRQWRYRDSRHGGDLQDLARLRQEINQGKRSEAMNYYALFYDVVEDYLSRRAEYREEHLRLAREAHRRGQLLLAGALTDPTLADPSTPGKNSSQGRSPLSFPITTAQDRVGSSSGAAG